MTEHAASGNPNTGAASRRWQLTRASLIESDQSTAEPAPAAGDSAHWREVSRLFDVHADFVYRVLLRLGVPRADAEDCVQDVFLVVAHRLSDYVERARSALGCL